MATQPRSVKDYLASLPEDRRSSLNEVREVMRRNLDSGYEEMISYGMIGYCIPHSLYPAGYHCDPKQPLPFAILGSKKNYMSLHLMCVYAGGQPDSDGAKLQEWFRAEWAKTGKKLDMGEACINFRKVDDLALDVIGKTVRKMPSKKWMAINTKFAEARQNARKPAKKKRPGPNRLGPLLHGRTSGVAPTPVNIQLRKTSRPEPFGRDVTPQEIAQRTADPGPAKTKKLTRFPSSLLKG